MNFGSSRESHDGLSSLLLAFLMLATLSAVGILVRPMTPIDETRYIGVAWEMWLRGDFLVPFKNGMPYSDKPPLMIWLYQIGWAAFGVNELWPRLVAPLFSALNLVITLRLAQRLWPERGDVGGTAVLILVSSLLWTVFSTAAMFDIILAFFTLLGMLGITSISQGRTRGGVLLLGVSIGLGVLAKGPVILLQVMPVALFAPWWAFGLRYSKWYGSLGVAVLIGAAIALSWAIPAGFSGGEAYRQAIFWGQTANRMVQSFAHQRPLWWYLPLLPVMFFPWAFWSGLWRPLLSTSFRSLDRGGRFCLAWAVPVLVAFSFISGKQPHYLIPLFPAFALFSARSVADAARVRGAWLPGAIVTLLGGAVSAVALGLIRSPIAGSALPPLWSGGAMMAAGLIIVVIARWFGKPTVLLALLGVVSSCLLQAAFFRPMAPSFDVRPMALAIANAQRDGRPVAHLGMYHDQYHFAGRLQRPLVESRDLTTLKAWLDGHGEGYVVVYAKDVTRLKAARTIAVQAYLDGQVALLDAPTALSVLAASAAELETP